MSAPLPLHSASRRTLWTLFQAGDGARLGAYLCDLARRGHADLLATFADHPLADDWRDMAWSCVQAHLAKTGGTVYVVANPVHVDLYKVGQTRGSVGERIKSLDSAGVVGYFVPVASHVVADRFAVEAAVHRRLRQREGCQQHKEFFACTWQQAISALEAEVAHEQSALAQFKA
jgi:hypothetical protein